MQFGSKPLIGLNADFIEASANRDSCSFVWSGYYDAILHSGGIPVVIPPLDSEDDLRQFLSHLSGVVLVGGGDMDPRRDGYVLHSTVRPMPSRREDFDRMFVRVIAETKMPVLAVGAGMQLLNVMLGGSLYFHIPVDLPKSMPHFDRQDPLHHRHSLEVTPGTMMERVYGDSDIRVNSTHHMAVREVAPGFCVSAVAPDGVVEAIESEDPEWLAVGTQFHPESSTATALDMRIFEDFVESVGGVPFKFSLVA